MKILVDAEFVMNYITGNDEDYADSSEAIMEMCADEKIDGYISFHSLSSILYILRRYSDFSRRHLIRRICTLFKVVCIKNEAIRMGAYDTDFDDFDDKLNYICAQSINADYIVTVNTKDYEHSKVKAVTPIELVQIVNA